MTEKRDRYAILRPVAMAAIALGLLGCVIILQMADFVQLWPFGLTSIPTIIGAVIFAIAIISSVTIMGKEYARLEIKTLLSPTFTKWFMRVVWALLIIRLATLILDLPNPFRAAANLTGLAANTLLAIIAILPLLWIIATGAHALRKAKS